MPLPDQGLEAGFQGGSVFEECERAGLRNSKQASPIDLHIYCRSPSVGVIAYRGRFIVVHLNFDLNRSNGRRLEERVSCKQQDSCLLTYEEPNCSPKPGRLG
jgi:hypothetical protein